MEAEIIRDRLYYCSSNQPRRLTMRGGAQAGFDANTREHWFTMDDELAYYPFFLDFGPLSLGCLYRFCHRMSAKLTDKALAGCVIVYYSQQAMHKRANAIYLMAAYSMLYLGKTPEDAIKPFLNVSPPVAPWHDASPTIDSFHLTTLDVLRGIQKARQIGCFSFDNFDIDEYETYEKVENGDMNWIVGGRFLAFAGPHDSRQGAPAGYHTTTPDDLIPYFASKGICAVVRLNKKYYNEKRFTNAGISHHDMYYLDGSNPPEHILQRFLQTCEATQGGIAVHCKAGLGRTGTCIGAYMMKHYRFTAREIIGWMRVCRPGSVIGPQQQFMESIQARMWEEGEMFRRSRELPSPAADSLLVRYSLPSSSAATTPRLQHDAAAAHSRTGLSNQRSSAFALASASSSDLTAGSNGSLEFNHNGVVSGTLASQQHVSPASPAAAYRVGGGVSVRTPTASSAAASSSALLRGAAALDSSSFGRISSSPITVAQSNPSHLRRAPSDSFLSTGDTSPTRLSAAAGSIGRHSGVASLSARIDAMGLGEPGDNAGSGSLYGAARATTASASGGVHLGGGGRDSLDAERDAMAVAQMSMLGAGSAPGISARARLMAAAAASDIASSNDSYLGSRAKSRPTGSSALAGGVDYSSSTGSRLVSYGSSGSSSSLRPSSISATASAAQSRAFAGYERGMAQTSVPVGSQGDMLRNAKAVRNSPLTSPASLSKMPLSPGSLASPSLGRSMPLANLLASKPSFGSAAVRR